MKYLGLLLSMTLFSAVSAYAQAAEAPATTQLGSSMFQWDKLEMKPTSVGERRDVARQPTATFDEFECHLSTLNPGQPSHPPHRHPQEELILLKEGTLSVHINGVEQRVGPGSLFFFASYDLHAVRNVGDIPAKYYVFNFSTALTKSIPVTATAEIADPKKLGSQVFDWEKLAARPTPKGERRDVVDRPTTTFANLESHVTTLRAGEDAHASHHHPDEEIIVVKEGQMRATVHGTTYAGGPGTIFFFASNDEHGLRNVGTTNATYYVLRIVTAATPKV